MSARASGRAIWSCSTKSPTAPPTAATASPSPSSPGCRRRSLARAKSVLAKLEAGRDATGGIAAGLDDLPLFASAAPAEPKPATRWPRRWRALDPDALTPREALDALYALKRAGGRARLMRRPRFELVADRRAIIDRRARRRHSCADGRLERAAPALLTQALAAGRAEIARRLAEQPARGRSAAAAMAYPSPTRSCGWRSTSPAASSRPKPAGASASRWSGWAAPGAARWRRTATST